MAESSLPGIAGAKDESQRPSERMYRRLVKFLGPHTTRLALKTFSTKAVGAVPEAVTEAQAPEVVRALRPLLRSMLGEAQAEIIVHQLLAEFP